MDTGYGAVYRDLYERHWWWRAREALVLDELTRLQPAGGFGRILDVGCGDGLFFGRLAELGQPEGVEVDERLVTAAGRSRGPIHVRPFDSSFDPGHRFGLILMLDVIEHLDDDVGALAHARSLLAPGGVILVTVPALPELWTRHDQLNHHRRRYRARALRRVGEEAGVHWEECRYAFHALAPSKLLVRGMERLVPGEPSPPSVPPAPLNAAAYAFFRIEQSLFRHLPLPFGSTLIAIGR